jgi:zinc/manganese transport system substrate-binding protein
MWGEGLEMRKTFLLTATLLSLLGAGRADAALHVVCTIPDLCDIASHVGGDLVETTALSKGYQDPHFVDPRPSFAVTLRNADLLLAVGLQLEVGWLPVLLPASRNEKIQVGQPGHLDCSTLVDLLEVPTEKISRTMGDLHPGGNPHYWLDPRNGVRLAFGIFKRLATLDPSNEATYRANYQRYARLIIRLAQKLQKELEPYAGSYLIPYHQSMSYFIHWSGLQQLGTIERLPGVPPSATHLAELHKRIESTPGRKVIVSETYYPDTTARRVAARFKLQYVRVAQMTGGLPEAKSYLDLLKANTERIVHALADSAK